MAADPEKHNESAIAKTIMGVSCTELHHHNAHIIPDVMVPFGAQYTHHVQ
jgi:hypothetical protein